MQLPLIGLLRRHWKKQTRKTFLSKRQIFVVITIILTTLMAVTQFSQGALRIEATVGLIGATYLLTAFAIREDLSGIEFLMLFILPVLFTTAVSLFYFLLPQRLLARLPFAVLYAIGIYAILLTENIYNVAAERTIQLLRAAQSVGFLITLITLFFLIDATLSMHNNALFNAVITFVVVFFLSLQSLWSMDLESRLSQSVVAGSATIALVIAESAAVLSFWPIRVTIAALFLTTLFYTIVGMAQQYIVGRLFQRTKNEFVLVLAAIFVLAFLATKWGFGNFIN